MRTLALLLIACGCNGMPLAPAAAAATAPKAEVPPPVVFAIPDEVMEFSVQFRGIHVGLVQTAIGKPGWIDGRRAIIVKSRGKTDGFAALIGDLTWELTSTIDLEQSVPIVDHEEAWAEFAGQKHHQDLPRTWSPDDPTHDVHSAVGVLRGWRAVAGQHADVQVAIDENRLPIGITDSGPDKIAGKPAIRYDGLVHDRVPFEIWVSDDVARVPLAFRATTDLGDISVDLVDYSVPKD